MELSDYLRIVRRWWWLVSALAVLTAVSAFAFTKMQPPVNTATTRFLIKSRPDFGQTQTIKELRRDFADWARTDIQAFAVIDTLGLDMNPYEMLSNFKAEASSDSSTITFQFEDENCGVAADVVRVWGDQLIQWRNEDNVRFRIEDRIEIESLYATPTCGATDESLFNGVAGGVFGLLLGTLLVLGLEWYGSTRVRYQKDLEKLQLSVIGKIPKAKQTKQTETLSRKSPKSSRNSRRRRRRN